MSTNDKEAIKTLDEVHKKVMEQSLAKENVFVWTIQDCVDVIESGNYKIIPSKIKGEPDCVLTIDEAKKLYEYYIAGIIKTCRAEIAEVLARYKMSLYGKAVLSKDTITAIAQQMEKQGKDVVTIDIQSNNIYVKPIHEDL